MKCFTCSWQFPIMRISCRVRYIGVPFSRGGVFNGVRRWDNTIDDESTSTTFTMLSACQMKYHNSRRALLAKLQYKN